MINSTKYIAQFVGFKTIFNEADFLKRWLPFALGFKKVGILSIDLYKISNNESLTFISRNIWEATTYFQNFPTGQAASGSGGGITVTQFGEYWIAENEIKKPAGMQLLFTNEKFPLVGISRARCSVEVPFENQIEFPEKESSLEETNSKNILRCIHINTI